MGKALVIKGADFSINGIQAEFTRLGWIGASTKNGTMTGTESGQFISSGINTNLNVRIEITAQLLAASQGETLTAFLPGCEINNMSAVRMWAQPTQVTAKFGTYEAGNITNCSVTISRNMWDGGMHVFVIDKTGVTIDGVLYTYDHEPIAVESQPIYLDSCSKAASTYNTAADYQGTPLTGKLRIKNVKIWSDYTDATTLVMDAIPVKRNNDDTICFYNSVDGTYKVRNNGSIPDYGL